MERKARTLKQFSTSITTRFTGANGGGSGKNVQRLSNVSGTRTDTALGRSGGSASAHAAMIQWLRRHICSVAPMQRFRRPDGYGERTVRPAYESRTVILNAKNSRITLRRMGRAPGPEGNVDGEDFFLGVHQSRRSALPGLDDG